MRRYYHGQDGYPRTVIEPMFTTVGIDRPLPPKERCIAIVGSRACTQYGAHIAGSWAGMFATAGFTVVSGGAFGIDISAHRGALASGGETVVVMATGITQRYPAAHREVFHDIEENARGWLVSTFEDDAVANRTRFLHRNGTIAELSAAVIVVEASVRSGSMNAAAQAYTQGVPVFAVPGPVTSVQSSGTHELIKRGFATLLDDPADLIGTLN